jgi:hypothetical protein
MLGKRATIGQILMHQKYKKNGLLGAVWGAESLSSDKNNEWKNKLFYLRIAMIIRCLNVVLMKLTESSGKSKMVRSRPPN